MKLYSIEKLRIEVPDFIEENYPKGETKDRGCATVAIALFLIWLEKKEKNPLEEK